MLLNRRDFLKRGVSYLGISALMPSVFDKALAALNEQNLRGAPADDGRILVVVQMAGGNDGLNTVIPIADTQYYSSRPATAIPSAQALPLNSTTGLHPGMTKMKELWDKGIVAIVEGVGYPNPNFSHFVSMRIWQKADPTEQVPQGWLGRYFEKINGSQEAPFLGLAIGNLLPLSLLTPAVTIPSLQNLNSYRFQGDPQASFLTAQRLETLSSLYASWQIGDTYRPQLNGSFKAAMRSSDALQKAHQSYKPAVTYPNNALASSLLIVAEAIAANLGVKVCHVTIGGFDTHADQLAGQAKQLGVLSESLHAFYTDLQAHNLDKKVAIMTWSEFGRRVKENGSDGTDHGSAGPLFFLGTPVKGGLYGKRPGLDNLDNGNLRYTVDFRSVYATSLRGWLGAPDQELLGRAYEPLPLWR